MSDDPSDPTTVPGSTAGDAAHSTRIPRIERPDSGGQTDKGRPRPKSAAKNTGGSTSTAVIPAVKDDVPTKAKSGTSSKNGASTAKASGAKIGTAAVKVDEPSVEEKAESNEAASAGRAATLRLTYIEPWSVTRMAFAISVALMIVGVVATVIFWIVLDFAGVWDQISGSVTSVLSDDDSAFDITDYLGFGRMVGLSLVLSAINVVVMTVLATIAAHLYNLGAHVLGGFRVTFTNDK